MFTEFFENIKLSKKFLISFSFVFLIILIMGFMVYSSVRGIQVQNESLESDTKLLTMINEIKIGIAEDMLLMRNMVEETESFEVLGNYMKGHQVHDTAFHFYVNEINALLSQQEAYLDRIKALNDAYSKNFKYYFAPTYDTMKQYIYYTLQVETGEYKEDKDFVKKRKRQIKKIRKNNAFVAEKNGYKLLETLSGLQGDFGQNLSASQSRIDAIIDGTLTKILIILFVAATATFFISQGLTRLVKGPVMKVTKFLEEIAGGNIPKRSLKETRDEIGIMSKKINTHKNNLLKSVQFAENIGNGVLDADFKVTDAIGAVLIKMRDQLMNVSMEEKKRKWVSDGLNTLNDQIRDAQNDIDKLADEVLSSLVRYMEANQGSMFILSENNESEPQMEMKACYAWERKKFNEKIIKPGCGLVGECWLEGDIIYMTQVPDSYINITSGLGYANPRSIILFPIKSDDKVFGVIEMAFFKELEEYQLEFMKQLGENLATAIRFTTSNDKTRKLLERSQDQAEELRAQEEEMRQNQEELLATQEEMKRQKMEMEDKVVQLEEQLGLLEERTF